jgi:hypothetical protein
MKEKGGKYEWKRQELCNSIKRQNLWIIDIEEGEEMYAQGIGNIFFKNDSRNLPKFWERDAHPGTWNF